MNNKSCSKFLNRKASSRKIWLSMLNNVLAVSVILFGVLITLKVKPEWKENISSFVLDKTISFTGINNWVQKTFGGIIPFDNILPSDSKVFNEKMVYDSANLYKDGVELSVGNNYLIPVLESGIIIYIGQKDDYGSCVVVQQIDGIDVWYGNVNLGDYNLYDYVTKGSLLGESLSDKLYLVFQKEGKYLDYQDYI